MLICKKGGLIQTVVWIRHNYTRISGPFKAKKWPNPNHRLDYAHRENIGLFIILNCARNRARGAVRCWAISIGYRLPGMRCRLLLSGWRYARGVPTGFGARRYFVVGRTSRIYPDQVGRFLCQFIKSIENNKLCRPIFNNRRARRYAIYAAIQPGYRKI